MMSRAGKVVVVSGTVVSGIVVSTAGGAVSGNVDSTSTNELVTSSDVLEALGVLLTAQADSTTKPSTISAREDHK
jgi:anthranilate phosphoribosyltransferase